jgi:hypothetical protein
MAKNRKNQSLKFGAAVQAGVLCLLIGGSGIGYVWQKNQIHALGRQIKERENRLVELRRQNKLRADQLTALIAPGALDARVRKLNLGLGQPPVSQIVRLVDVLPESGFGSSQETKLAEHRSVTTAIP